MCELSEHKRKLTDPEMMFEIDLISENKYMLDEEPAISEDDEDDCTDGKYSLCDDSSNKVSICFFFLNLKSPTDFKSFYP